MSVDDFLFGQIGAPINIAAPTTNDIILPPSWMRVLTDIRQQAGWMCSTIAGGALRDIDNGRPVKDVDIFVPYLGSNETSLLALQRAVSDAPIMEIEHSSHNTSQVGVDGISHFHFEVDGWKFEVSQKTDQFDYKTLLDSFDIGICMISLDPGILSYSVYRTPEYVLDKSNQEIRVVRKTGGREMDHAARLKRKYKDWYIVPL